MRIAVFALAALGLAACSPAKETSPDLMDALTALCGQAFEGRVTSDDPRDADFASQRLVMHVRDCEPDVVRVPFHVGEDRSRVWVFTRQADGTIELKHNHRHEDGEQDVLSMYGGRTVGAASGTALDFPADQFSKDLFERENIPASMANTWSVSVTDTAYVYALTRPDRHFRAEFDLTSPVETPPAAWGDEAL
jgi:hypothetical protein